MPKIVGNASAIREWAMTGQDFSAEEALRVGFVSRVVQGGRDEVIGKICYARRFVDVYTLSLMQAPLSRLQRQLLPNLLSQSSEQSIFYYMRKTTRQYPSDIKDDISAH